MNGETKTVIRYFDAADVDGEEQYLQDMSAEGWLLESVAGGQYTFRRGDTEPHQYHIDYQTHPESEHGAYLQLFRDAGWEPVLTLPAVEPGSYWHYFRRPGEAPVDTYPDDERRLAAMYGQRRLFIRLTAIDVAILFVLFYSRATTALRGFWDGVMTGVFVGLGALVILLIVLLAVLQLRIRRAETRQL